jgi:protein required for attachment to host cells
LRRQQSSAEERIEAVRRSSGPVRNRIEAFEGRYEIVAGFTPGIKVHEENRSMGEIRMPHDTLVLVGDGRKALFLRNHGNAKFPDLRVERVFADVNPSTHEQGTDRPGRVFSSASGGNRRSSIEGTDWHDLEEHKFARDVAGALERLVRDSKAKALVIACPPRTLADLRHALHADVKKCIVAEVAKDLTKHPVHEIEKHLAG